VVQDPEDTLARLEQHPAPEAEREREENQKRMDRPAILADDAESGLTTVLNGAKETEHDVPVSPRHIVISDRQGVHICIGRKAPAHEAGTGHARQDKTGVRKYAAIMRKHRSKSYGGLRPLP